MGDISLIADDLTGITDCISSFIESGYRCSFFTDNRICDNSDIYFFNSRTRNTKNINIIQKKWKDFRRSYIPESIIYKKVDSTLRGNILCEIECFFNEFSPEKILFLPENPKNNRIYKNGKYIVDGIPIEESFYANDPKSPADCNIFKKIYEKFGDKVYSPEIIDQNDIDHHVNIAINNQWGIVASSSAISGFTKKIHRPLKIEKNTLPVYIFSGSLNEKNKRQIEIFKNNFKKNEYSIEDISVSKDEKEFNKKARDIGNRLIDKEVDLIICGGETSELILDGFKNRFEAIGILDSGIPVLGYKNRKIILKPGGFGKMDFYISCLKTIK